MFSSLLKRTSSLRALVIGDAIQDEYAYVWLQGMSPKEPILTAMQRADESFRGGTWAAAKHAEAVCGSVTLHVGTDVTVKRRFIEQSYLRKLFEVHERRSGQLPSVDEPDYAAYDLVIVTDFGHGYMTKERIAAVCAKAKFLAVNTQTNSSNYGFNLITKYPRADYVVLDDPEARLAAHDRDSPIENVIERLDFPRIVVTLGPRGSIGRDNGKLVRSEAVSRRVVDTMGAGDAFFCVTAPFAAIGTDMETLLRIGNAAGAIKCSIVGHREAVTREALLSACAD